MKAIRQKEDWEYPCICGGRMVNHIFEDGKMAGCLCWMRCQCKEFVADKEGKG